MESPKFSDAQKAFVLRQADDYVPAAEACRKTDISQATFFNWKKYREMLPNEIHRLKQLDLSLDKDIFQNVIKRKF